MLSCGPCLLAAQFMLFAFATSEEMKDAAFRAACHRASVEPDKGIGYATLRQVTATTQLSGGSLTWRATTTIATSNALPGSGRLGSKGSSRPTQRISSHLLIRQQADEAN